MVEAGSHIVWLGRSYSTVMAFAPEQKARLWSLLTWSSRRLPPCVSRSLASCSHERSAGPFWSVGLPSRFCCMPSLPLLPVVWMQIRMRDLARASRDAETALPGNYYRLYGLWFAFGFPPFTAVLVAFCLMLTRPSIIW